MIVNYNSVVALVSVFFHDNHSFSLDLNNVIYNPSQSRCGKIFSPENLLAKSKIDSLKPWVDPVAVEIKNKAIKNKEPEVKSKIDFQDIDTKQLNMACTGNNTGVLRLLRHLKKARLEKL